MTTPKFFITHSWKDIEFARRLFKDLTAHGVEGWMDDSVIRGGQRLAEEINRGLEGCDVYLPIMSPAALDSPWCWEEINAAITLSNRRDRPKQLRIIPIIAVQCEMPALLGARLYFDFAANYENALNDLLNKGFGVTSKPTLPRSLHPSPATPVEEKPATPTKAPPKPAVVRYPSLEDVENLYLEALEAFHLEKWQQAVEGFRKVVTLRFDYEDAAAKLKLAERALHEAELSVLYDGATEFIEAGKWQNAVEQLETLLKIDDGYKDTRARLASAKNMLQAADLYMQASEALAAKRWNDAVRALESLLTLVPNYQDAATKLVEAKRWAQLPDLYRRALKAIDAKQWQDAKLLLEQVRSVDSNYRESKTFFERAEFEEDARRRAEEAQERGRLMLEEQRRLLQTAIDKGKKATQKKRDELLARLEEEKYKQMLVEQSVQGQGILHPIIHPKTGKELLLVPAGEFVMGEGSQAHKVYLNAFYISRFPVTNAEYKRFVDATGHDPLFVDADWAKPYHWDKKNKTFPKDKANHPVVLVSWRDAVAYCEWAGARLPTEAEWEKAASWDDAKKEKRVYPWGDKFDANKCNTIESKIGGTTPVGKYSPQGDSAYGIADMAGNVWEWCADWYDENYYKNSPQQNPGEPDSVQFRVLRGGSWSYDQSLARCAYRFRNDPVLSLGFRIAESVPS